MQARTLAIINTALPIVSVHLAYSISISQDLVAVCIPYIDGCTSISRAARKGDAIFLFRPLMIMHAVFLMLFWQVSRHWLAKLDNTYRRSREAMFWIGCIGALFLVLYANFLGFDGDMYQFMRRFGVTIFFSFTGLAQMLQVRILTRLDNDGPAASSYAKVVRYQTTLCAFMLLLGITNVFMKITGIVTDESENIIEWNFGLIMALFYLGNAYLWHKTAFRTHYDFDN